MIGRLLRTLPWWTRPLDASPIRVHPDTATTAGRVDARPDASTLGRPATTVDADLDASGRDRTDREALEALRAAALPVAAATAGRHPRHARRPGSDVCLPGCDACELAALLRELGTTDPAWTLLTTTRPSADVRRRRPDVRARCEVAS